MRGRDCKDEGCCLYPQCECPKTGGQPEPAQEIDSNICDDCNGVFKMDDMASMTQCNKCQEKEESQQLRYQLKFTKYSTAVFVHDNGRRMEQAEVADLLNTQGGITISSKLKRLVDEQANDEGLWCGTKYASEAYLQNALRQLHAAIEGISPEDCAMAALHTGDKQ